MVEILISIGVISVLLLGVISGFFTTISASRRAEGHSRAESVLASMAERVQTMPYHPCASLTQVRADVAALAHPTGYVIEVTGLDYLGPEPAANGAQAFSPSCTQDRGAQRISLSVRRTVAGSRPFRGQVVLRNAAAVRTW